MTWSQRVREDGVPDYGLGWGCIHGRGGIGGISGGYIEEDLFRIVGEEGREVWLEC
jgi:hypothetical protein